MEWFLKYFFCRVKTISSVPLCTAHRALSFAYTCCMCHASSNKYCSKHLWSFICFWYMLSFKGRIICHLLFSVRTISSVPLRTAHRALSFAHAQYAIFKFYIILLSFYIQKLYFYRHHPPFCKRRRFLQTATFHLKALTLLEVMSFGHR